MIKKKDTCANKHLKKKKSVFFLLVLVKSMYCLPKRQVPIHHQTRQRRISRFGIPDTQQQTESQQLIGPLQEHESQQQRGLLPQSKQTIQQLDNKSDDAMSSSSNTSEKFARNFDPKGLLKEKFDKYSVPLISTFEPIVLEDEPEVESHINFIKSRWTESLKNSSINLFNHRRVAFFSNNDKNTLFSFYVNDFVLHYNVELDVAVHGLAFIKYVIETTANQLLERRHPKHVAALKTWADSFQIENEIHNIAKQHYDDYQTCFSQIFQDKYEACLNEVYEQCIKLRFDTKYFDVDTYLHSFIPTVSISMDFTAVSLTQFYAELKNKQMQKNISASDLSFRKTNIFIFLLALRVHASYKILCPDPNDELTYHHKIVSYVSYLVRLTSKSSYLVQSFCDKYIELSDPWIMQNYYLINVGLQLRMVFMNPVLRKKIRKGVIDMQEQPFNVATLLDIYFVTQARVHDWINKDSILNYDKLMDLQRTLPSNASFDTIVNELDNIIVPQPVSRVHLFRLKLDFIQILTNDTDYFPHWCKLLYLEANRDKLNTKRTQISTEFKKIRGNFKFSTTLLSYYSRVFVDTVFLLQYATKIESFIETERSKNHNLHTFSNLINAKRKYSETPILTEKQFQAFTAITELTIANVAKAVVESR